MVACVFVWIIACNSRSPVVGDFLFILCSRVSLGTQVSPCVPLKYVFSQTITCINDFVLCTLLRTCKLLCGLDLLIPICMGRLIYNYHHSTILHWKISQVCCRLYCYECAAQVTTPTAVNEYSLVLW